MKKYLLAAAVIAAAAVATAPVAAVAVAVPTATGDHGPGPGPGDRPGPGDCAPALRPPPPRPRLRRRGECRRCRHPSVPANGLRRGGFTVWSTEDGKHWSGPDGFENFRSVVDGNIDRSWPGAVSHQSEGATRAGSSTRASTTAPRRPAGSNFDRRRRRRTPATSSNCRATSRLGRLVRPHRHLGPAGGRRTVRA